MARRKEVNAKPQEIICLEEHPVLDREKIQQEVTAAVNTMGEYRLHLAEMQACLSSLQYWSWEIDFKGYLYELGHSSMVRECEKFSGYVRELIAALGEFLPHAMWLEQTLLGDRREEKDEG